jgi:hypothetical protein
MRISVVEGDSGYNTWQDLNKAIVTLDGEEKFGVLTADEMLGLLGLPSCRYRWLFYNREDIWTCEN